MFVGLHADLRIEMFVVVTTFYTLDGMKSILLPKFVFFRSRLRLSLKNTNLLFYCFICFLQGCCTSYYNIPSPSETELYLLPNYDKDYAPGKSNKYMTVKKLSVSGIKMSKDREIKLTEDPKMYEDILFEKA